MTKRRLLRFLTAGWAVIFFLGAGIRVLADCTSFGLPFTDLDSTSFCAEIAEAYYTGITHGTSPTTFSPSDNVTREQAAAFATRTLDASLARGSRRAALGQWWTTTPHYDVGLGLTSVGAGPGRLVSDGSDLWVANYFDGTVSRVHSSDGKVLETWTGANHATGVVAAMGRVFITGNDLGTLYMIDPSQPPGNVTTVVNNPQLDDLGSIVFDGTKLWILSPIFVWIVDPNTWQVTVGGGSDLSSGLGFDGQSIWFTDSTVGFMNRVDLNGKYLQTVKVGYLPRDPVFDGNNLWVPNSGDNSLTVVRARDGAIIKTISAATGVHLDVPTSVAFDGRRILVSNVGGGFLSLFNAADLSWVGNYSTLSFGAPSGACSDGLDFWVSFPNSAAIGRF